MRWIELDLSVNEIFPSFQGEGIHTGLATTFVRLAGCNLKCQWCDTKYALKLSDGEMMSIDDILRKVKDIGLDLICLTGGEPLFQKDAFVLVRTLIEEGFQIDIETNGSMDIGPFSHLGKNVTISMDVKTPSSGESSSFLKGNLKKLRKDDQLKFIIGSDDDLMFSVDLIEKELPGCNIIITPVDNEGGERIAERLMDFVIEKDLPENIRLMIQTHKVIWHPARRGV